MLARLRRLLVVQKGEKKLDRRNIARVKHMLHCSNIKRGSTV